MEGKTIVGKSIQLGLLVLRIIMRGFRNFGDPLKALNEVVDGELFRKPLRKALKKAVRSDKKKGWRAVV